VAETADRVVVMYAGRKVEEGPVSAIFAAPAHPYTRALLHATRWDGADAGYLPETPTASRDARQAGCCFADRCEHARARCRAERPTPFVVGPEHAVACFLHQPVPA